METKVTVREAAERLGIGQETIRAGLISGELPIGAAVKCKRSFSYIIPRERFESWVSGKDLLIKVPKRILLLFDRVSELPENKRDNLYCEMESVIDDFLLAYRLSA